MTTQQESFELFDTPIDRTHISSMKWNVHNGELPMWVADMDFATAPAILNAMQARLNNGTFGYSDIPDDFYTTVSTWWKEQHNFEIAPENIIFTCGVVPAISSAVRSLTNVAEKVVVQPPVYNIFYNSIINNGRRVLEAPLARDTQSGEYSMDFEALEDAFSDPLTTLMILCNPHNPTGNIWTAEDLAHVGDLAAAHHVTVLSDEIHCEVVRPGMKHIPFDSVNETCRNVAITCASPSKAFNIAGLHSAYTMIDNDLLRHRFERGANTDEVAEPNAFACASTIAAYQNGYDWLTSLNQYIQRNKDYARKTIENSRVPISVTPSDATYLLWLDCSEFTEDAQELANKIRQKSGLILSAGNIYGECGRQFLRINLGTTFARVHDGVNRLLTSCESLI